MAERADEYYAHALDLLSTFSTKHGEIEQNRNVVRQREMPDEELKGKRVITVRQAYGFALVTQLRAFFSRAATQIKVRPENNSRKELGYTTEQEQWLTGFTHARASRAGFVYSDAIWHGLESGEMILQSSFNPSMARNGELGLRARAIDPRSAAYEWTDDGLGCFVIDETERIGVAWKELFGNYQRAGKRGYGKGFSLPRDLEQLAEQRPTETVKLTRYYDAVDEYLWINTQLIWVRAHHMGQVPFHVGYFYDMPADWSHPEERGRGVISPIRDLLEEKETLYDIWATNAEFSQRPMVLYFDQTQNKWIIGVGNPNSKFDSPVATPPKEWKGSADYQLLEKLSVELNEQIEMNTLPRTALQGQQGDASGYALSLYNEPIKARFDSLRPYAELCLGSHYELMLLAYKKFSKSAMARLLAPGDTTAYLDSFAVSVDIESKPGGKQKQQSWVNLNGDEISEHPYVEVSLKPNLPTDKGAQMQQFDLAMRSGFVPRMWAYENILDADDPDAMDAEWKQDWLVANDEVTKAFVTDAWREDWLAQNPEMKKRFVVWGEEQAAESEQQMQDAQNQQNMQGAPPMDQMGGMPQIPMSPMDFAAQMGNMGGANALGSQPVPPMPIGQGLPSAANLMAGQGPPPPDYMPGQEMVPQ